MPVLQCFLLQACFTAEVVETSVIASSEGHSHGFDYWSWKTYQVRQTCNILTNSGFKCVPKILIMSLSKTGNNPLYKCVLSGKPEWYRSKSGDLSLIPLRVYTNWFSKDLSTVSISMWEDKAGINSKTTSVYLLWGKIKERKKGLACFLGAEDFILQEQGDTQPQHPSPLEVPSRPTVSNLCIYQNVDTGVAWSSFTSS